MQLHCQQSDLKKGLNAVGRTVGTRSALPILACVLLEARDGQFKIAASNLGVGITCWLDAQVEAEGAIALPFRLFNDIVSNLPNEEVRLTLNADTQTVKIVCARFTSNIKGRDADDFPTIPTTRTREATLTLPGAVLRQAIEQVAFAASDEDSRMALKGVLVRFDRSGSDGGALRLSATDSYRLAVRDVALPDVVLPDPLPAPLLVPAQALGELARIIGGSDAPVRVALLPDEGKVLFGTETVDLAARLIGERFPDFERIIPTEHATRTVVDTQALLQAAKLAALFATTNQNYVKLTIAPGETAGRLVVSTNETEVGDNTGDLEGVVEGAPGEIAMNVKFLTEALAAVGTPQVALETQTPQKPALFKPIVDDGDEGNYLHLIMPVKMR
jgi:DNA polymerase-3 subunit beta